MRDECLACPNIVSCPTKGNSRFNPEVEPRLHEFVRLNQQAIREGTAEYPEWVTVAHRDGKFVPLEDKNWCWAPVVTWPSGGWDEV